MNRIYNIYDILFKYKFSFKKIKNNKIPCLDKNLFQKFT